MQIPATSFDLVIVCDDPRRDDGVVRQLLAAQARTRYIALHGVGEQAASYATRAARALQPTAVVKARRLRRTRGIRYREPRPM